MISRGGSIIMMVANCYWALNMSQVLFHMVYQYCFIPSLTAVLWSLQMKRLKLQMVNRPRVSQFIGGRSNSITCIPQGMLPQGIDSVLRMLGHSMKVRKSHSTVGKARALKSDLCVRPASYKPYYSATILNLSEPPLHSRGSYATSPAGCGGQVQLAMCAKVPYKS